MRNRSPLWAAIMDFIAAALLTFATIRTGNWTTVSKILLVALIIFGILNLYIYLKMKKVASMPKDNPVLNSESETLPNEDANNKGV